MTRCGLFVLMGALSLHWPQQAQAFTWKNLWQTANQQGQSLMEKGRYQEAKETFEQPDWKATAAYRAGDYELAAKLYGSLHTKNADYNQGNALAHMGRYEEAIDAYNKALQKDPNHLDAQHNREVVQALLKQDQQKQDQQKQDQQKQDQQKQDQQQQNQQQQDQQKQDQQQQDQQQQDQQQQDQQQQDQQQQDQQQQDQQQQDQQQQNQQKQDQQQQNQQQQESQQQKQQTEPSESEKKAHKDYSDQEKQQAKEHWLRLIPDDPGGLMREKFLRDHLRRQRGWN